MCGVIGVQLERVTEENIQSVRNLFLQSMIRGKHATGVTYFNGEQLVTIKEPIPADKFIEKYDPTDWIYKHDMGSSKENLPCIAFVGHTRYSTSDLHTNQPFVGCMEDQQVAVAHNGVISQEAQDTWEYDTISANDSELLLRCIQDGKHPLEVYANRSMAVTAIETLNRVNEDGTKGAKFAMVHGYRNHERPLWKVYESRGNKGIIFASTADILHRSGFAGASRLDPFIEYSRGGLSRRWHPMHLGTEEPKDLQP